MTITVFPMDGTDGATATQASTGAFDIQVTNTGATLTHRTSCGLHGTTGLQIDYGTGTTNPAMGRWNVPVPAAEERLSMRIKCPATNPSVVHQVWCFRFATGYIMRITRNASGDFIFNPSTGTPTTILTAAQLGSERFPRMTIDVVANSTTAGTAVMKFYNTAGTQIGTTTSLTAQNLSANNISVLQLGTVQSEGNSIVYGFEDVQIENGAGSEIPEYVPTTPLATPSVTATVVNATSIGGSDGQVNLSWSAIANATKYEVAVADANDATTGFVVLASNVTGTSYTITGRSAGPGRARVVALP